MPDGLEIRDKETALRRLDLLQASILQLKDDIPDMAKMTATLKAQLEGMDRDIQTMLLLVNQLLKRQNIWQEWLAERLTFLASLKTYLEMDTAEEERSA